MTYEHQAVVIKGDDEKSHLLAAQLHLHVVTELSNTQELYLQYNNHALCLCRKSGKENLSINVDFISSQLQFRQQHLSLKTEPLLRAIGCNQKKRLSVVDATAGLGRDSFLIANYNCDVVLVEQSPIVAALLEDGLLRANSVPELQSITNHMHLVQQNAIEYLQSVETQPDAVYLDPMFPPRTKTAKVKKEMQVLHALLGSSEIQNDANLLLVALKKVKGRVIVKRPKTADFLANKKPSYSLDTKAMRFDVYVKN